MHTYDDYEAPTDSAIIDLVTQFPFAIMTTSQTDSAPVATHLPIVIPTDERISESLVGHRLWGHMGRANPHWQLFGEHPEALLVFTTSHAYVSPSSYRFEPAAPTLDYAAVHLQGHVDIFDDTADSLRVVEHTVEVLETDRDPQWSMDSSRDFFKQIVQGVVAFSITITNQQAMFKLSQDMDHDIRNRIHNDLTTGVHRHDDVANLIRRPEPPR